MSQMAFKLKEGQSADSISLGGGSQFAYNAEHNVIHGSFVASDVKFLQKHGYERAADFDAEAAVVPDRFPEVLEQLKGMRVKEIRAYIDALGGDVPPADEKRDELIARAHRLYCAQADAPAAPQGSGAEGGAGNGAAEDGKDAGADAQDGSQPGNQTQGGGSTFSQSTMAPPNQS